MIPTPTSSCTNIFSLPTEVIETILIACASSGFPSAIAALGQSSRHFHDIIYRSPDQHLWREVFLTTFDDPRPAIDARDSGRRISDHEQDNSVSGSSNGTGIMAETLTLCWKDDFTARARAAAYIRKHTESVPASDAAGSIDKVSDDPEVLATLQTLLNVLYTALPIPSSLYTLSLVTSWVNFPVRDIVFVDRNHKGISDPPGSESLNTAWAEKILARGFPPELTRKLTPFLNREARRKARANGTLSSAGYDSKFDESEVGRAFHRLVCCTGFIPVPEVIKPQLQPEEEADASDEVAMNSSDSEEEETAEPEYMSITAQETRARRLARMRVYNLQYLTRERHWGPYMRVANSSIVAPRSERRFPFVLVAGVRRNANQDNINDGDEELDDDADDGDIDDDGTIFPLLNLDEPEPDANLPPPPDPSELHADWAYLSSVRQVVEANLQDVVGEQVLGGLRDLRALRIGSAPRDVGQVYWDDAVLKNKEDMMDGDVEGWDWAGVEGAWRRCVCWMDYRDLIVNNLNLGSARFSDPQLQEAMRIIPMTLKISGYSAAPPEWPGRPVINIEGQAAGPDHTMRKVWGTVAMMGDGNVRWNLIHCRRDGDEWQDEWVMEGVLVGGVGSAMGVLGMWTGASHDRTDPLGPSWMWKLMVDT